ncbi:MAG: amidohydrolase [Gammaproteobacteria bacterium]|nr:amidohydrolase [Gammaproteobacteria bacterium]
MDTIIKGGLVVDGTGGAPRTGDVGIKAGRIVAPAEVDSRAQTIDAVGKVVAPGFIDIHTHFDPQLCWDGLATPSLEHGVTTVVIGNCSLSLAPVRPDGAKDKLISMFQVIEDIKKPTFDAAVPFSWESFPEYLDFIRGNLGVNVGALIGHSAVRYYVMGAASQERAATKEEIDAMCRIVEEAMAAGALGISSSYVDMDEEMKPVPSRFAEIDEKLALAQAMAASGRGIWQVVPYFMDPVQVEANIKELGDISLAAGVPCSLQPVLASGREAAQVAALAAEHERGARVYGQTMPRTFDMAMRLSETSMMLFGYPKWKSFMDLPLEERREAFADPANRDALTEEMVPRASGGGFGIANMAVGEVQSEANKVYQGRKLAEIAEAEGKRIGEVVLDLSNRDGLDTEFELKGVINADRQAVAELINSPYCHFGASDAGAHITQFCGTGDTTYMLAHYVRETNHMPLERAIYRMTGEVARDWGIHDRGTLQAGQAADVVIFDRGKVAITKNEFVDDFPGEARRYMRRAEGYDAVLVNGEIVYTDDGYTDARPGKVV